MRRLMEYKIISGRTVEIRRTMLPFREKGQKVRRGKKVGKTSLRKILANEREAVKNLARTLNCNFRQGDCWITLTYPENALPASREEAKAELEKLMRKFREAYRKRTGKKIFRYAVSIGDRDGKTGLQEKRLHIHIVMPAVEYELVTALWPAEDVTYRRLDGRGDYTGIARYMVTNAGPADGKKRWSTSKGMLKPAYTEPVPVERREKIRIPRDVSLKANEEFMDEETGMFSAYVRYTMPRNAKVGSRVSARGH